MRRRGTGLLGVVALLAIAACGASADIARQTFRPTTSGALTVATALPAPGFWEGSVDDLSGGFEWGIAMALADRFDLELHVVEVPFERLVAGDLGDADLALAQITVTDDRAGLVAFSLGYYVDDAGVVLPAGDELTDLNTARELRWAVQRDTVEADLLVDTVRPDADPILFDDPLATVDAVAAGRADAALLDLSTALVIADGRADVTTAARIAIDDEMAAALPLDSANVEAVDAALRSLLADGTVEDLASEYLHPAFETEPDSLPVIRTPDD